jgi:alpha-1,6-mannosyltransferase
LAQWTSPPTAVGMTVGYGLRAAGWGAGFDAAVAVARGVGLIALVAIVLVLLVRAARAAHDPMRSAIAGAGLAFAAVVLLGPVFYPWYALTPLALLAVSIVEERTRAWLGVASAGLAFVILPNGVGLAPRTKLPGALLVTAGVAVAAVVGWRRRRGRYDVPIVPPTTPTSRASSGRERSRSPDPRSER